MQSVMNRRDLGYLLVGFVERRGVVDVKDFGRFRALGTVADIPSVIPERRVDDVIIALPSSSHEEIMSVLALCEQHGVAVKLLPDLFELSLSRVQIDNIAGIPLLDVREQPLRPIARAVKRAMDVLVAAVMLTFTLPVAAVIALLIRLESSGPPLLRQERVGMGGRAFCCWKFRTMRSDAEVMQEALLSINEATWPMFKMRHDPRVTGIGRTIRRWSLDELPQLWNVLVGDMSVVGPRPPLLSEVREYEAWHHRRLEVKPGLTGLWQVSGRSDLPFDEMVYMDIYYVENWSLALDIKIMLRTVIAVLARQGAY